MQKKKKEKSCTIHKEMISTETGGRCWNWSQPQPQPLAFASWRSESADRSLRRPGFCFHYTLPPSCMRDYVEPCAGRNSGHHVLGARAQAAGTRWRSCSAARRGGQEVCEPSLVSGHEPWCRRGMVCKIPYRWRFSQLTFSLFTEKVKSDKSRKEFTVMKWQ